MSETVAAMSLGVRTLSSVGAYLELTKPRVVAMVLVTTLAGYYLGTSAAFDFHLAFVLLGATGLAAAGTMALNQYLERDLDAKMDRTRSRPLPQGRLSPESALIFGLVVTAVGCAILWARVNPLTALVTAAISIIYLLAYTPLKRVSPLCSVIGAVPGALPPVAGWAAARGTLSIEAWVLFAIMFL